MNAQSTALVGEVLDSMPAPAAANPYPALIEKIIDKGGDLSALDKMLDLQIRWEEHEARKAFVAAMAAFKAEPMEILKRKLVAFETRNGDTTSYTHAELSDVTEVVVPAMAKHGLSHDWSVKQEGGKITVTCTVTHARGHSKSVEMSGAPDGSGAKNAIQQVASTTTYLQRYTLLAATGMATKGMDDDGSGAGAPTETTDEVPADELDGWRTKITDASAPSELRKIKSEMTKHYGKTQAIPKVLIRTYNGRWAQLTAGTEAQA